ncbi:hypothetical protein R1flu_010522 [Riccia fluitans]|uniref:Uncharacterized protein n=1 Tax=Riccia fluitans TaxID=41844 RepID=A0ABD1Z601_9MARC
MPCEISQREDCLQSTQFPRLKDPVEETSAGKTPYGDLELAERAAGELLIPRPEGMCPQLRTPLLLILVFSLSSVEEIIPGAVRWLQRLSTPKLEMI